MSIPLGEESAKYRRRHDELIVIMNGHCTEVLLMHNESIMIMKGHCAEILLIHKASQMTQNREQWRKSVKATAARFEPSD